MLHHGELAFALNKKTKDDVDTVMGDDDDDGGVNAEEQRALLAQRRRAAKGDLQFPDEVEYEEETSSSIVSDREGLITVREGLIYNHYISHRVLLLEEEEEELVPSEAASRPVKALQVVRTVGVFPVIAA
jgi:hypothetical protein